MKTGFKPIPLSLKVVAILSLLWVLGSVSAVSMRFAQGLPFFGMWLTGAAAVAVMLALDIVGPLAFLYALYNRLSWGPTVVYAYTSMFILNSVVALFTTDLGVAPLLVPASVYALFLAVVVANQNYFP